jgi:hypothetical protein
LYDFRGKFSQEEFSINYYDSIKQNSGEEWNDVELSLNTANPNTKN